MIARTFDAAVINAILNHPAVHGEITPDGYGPVDCSAWAADPANIILGDDGISFAFISQGQGVYELHSAALPEHRGPRVVRAFRDALKWMFCRTDCEEIVTQVPDGCSGGAAIVRIGQFYHEGDRPGLWLKNGEAKALSFHSLDIRRWINTDPTLAGVGAEMHDRLHRKDAETGRAMDRHPDDDMHNRHSGALIEIMLGGQAVKAVIWYNRIARFYRYGEVTICSVNPLILDLQTDHFLFRDGSYEVLPCPGEQ